jgi:hypothetical protein
MNNNKSISCRPKLPQLSVIGTCSLILSVLLLTSCKKDVDPTPAPVITSFSPASGNAPAGVLPGTLVTITGSNFSTTAIDNQIKFNGTAATTASAATTQLTVAVPQGATTGKITVTVNGLTATSNTDFIVLPSPTITNFVPPGALPGAFLVITGTNFKTITNENVVKINGTSATVTASTSTQLTVTIPAGASTGKVTVELNGATATSVSDFEVLKDIPRTGLVAFYPFTNNGNCSNNALLNLEVSNFNQPTLTIDRFGNTGQALNFSGTQSTQIAQRVIPNKPWTISVWMDPGAFNNNIMDFMASLSGTSGIVFQFRNGSTGDFYVAGFGQSTAGNYSFVETLPGTRFIPGDGVENNWFLLTMTYNGSVFKIYKDNTEVYSANSTFETPTENFFELGSTGIYSASKYIGKMDDLLIYDRALTLQELTQLFQQTASKY